MRTTFVAVLHNDKKTFSDFIKSEKIKETTNVLYGTEIYTTDKDDGYIRYIPVKHTLWINDYKFDDFIILKDFYENENHNKIYCMIKENIRSGDATQIPSYKKEKDLTMQDVFILEKSKIVYKEYTGRENIETYTLAYFYDVTDAQRYAWENYEYKFQFKQNKNELESGWLNDNYKYTIRKIDITPKTQQDTTRHNPPSYSY